VIGTVTRMADTQMALAVRLRPDASFASFVAGANVGAVALLRGCAEGQGEQQVLIFGPPGEGKTHLVQASCHAAVAAGHRAACLDLSAAGMGPGVLDGWQDHALLCLDGVDAVAGDAAWESALFVLLQERRDAGRAVILTCRSPIASAGYSLDDLRTRLAWGPVIALRALDDAARIEAMQRRATARGMQLPVETARYLLARVPRNMVQLDALLDRLDADSLRAQRKLTVPFVRGVLASDG
jgi:DnaA-homolog protein